MRFRIHPSRWRGVVRSSSDVEMIDLRSFEVFLARVTWGMVAPRVFVRRHDSNAPSFVCYRSTRHGAEDRITVDLVAHQRTYRLTFADPHPPPLPRLVFIKMYDVLLWNFAGLANYLRRNDSFTNCLQDFGDSLAHLVHSDNRVCRHHCMRLMSCTTRLYIALALLFCISTLITQVWSYFNFKKPLLGNDEYPEDLPVSAKKILSGFRVSRAPFTRCCHLLTEYQVIGGLRFGELRLGASCMDLLQYRLSDS